MRIEFSVELDGKVFVRMVDWPGVPREGERVLLGDRFKDPKQVLLGLALSEHMGDVNDELPSLCRLFDLPEPEWSDDLNRYVMAGEAAGQGKEE